MALIYLFLIASIGTLLATPAPEISNSLSSSNPQQGFVYNISNVNGIVALACSSLTHVENERRGMDGGEDYFYHQWQIFQASGIIKIDGFCAIPYHTLNSGKRNRHKLNLEFRQISDANGLPLIEVRGTIVGKTIKINMASTTREGLYDLPVPGTLSDIDAISLGFNLIDIFRSMRTGALLRSLESGQWVSSINPQVLTTTNLGLSYRFPQFNGRQLALAVTSGKRQYSIFVRSANILNYYETNYFNFTKDLFGYVRGFQNESLPNNHKFYIEPSEKGYMIKGCSSLAFESEFSFAKDIDMNVCHQVLEDSAFLN